MSLTVALNTAVSGLFANQQAIAATSENIANVNTENFSRREAQFKTDAIPNQFAGVSVDIVRTGANRFLQNAAFSSAADAGAAAVVADALAAVESSLGAPGENLSFANKLDDAFAALAELSASPASVASKSVALSALDDAFAAFARTTAAIDGELQAASSRLTQQSERANTLLREIFDLNQIVSESAGAGDGIDARLDELARLLEINVARDDDGRVTVSTADGQLLVNAGELRSLSANIGAPTTIALSSVDPETGASAVISADITASVSGGELSGLVTLINSELPALRQSVVEAARAIAEELNAVYAGNASVGSTIPATTPLIVEAAGIFSVNAAIITDPASFAVARPINGGVGGASDGAGAGALAAVGASMAARGAADLVANIGAAARSAESARATANAFNAEIDIRRASEQGVNLDEELSNLIVFQRAYGANARVIAAVDELYQTLLSIL